MAIEPIPVIRIHYLNLFMDVSQQCNASRQACLRQFNLPVSLCDKENSYVPLTATLSFVQWMALGRDIEDFILRAGTQLRTSDFAPELCRALCRAETLESALISFCRLADREQSVARYRLFRDGGTVRILSSFDTVPPSTADYYAEWLRILSLMTVIRHFTGTDWMPSEIALQSHLQPRQPIRRAFPQTRFVTGQAETGVAFPAEWLRLSTIREHAQMSVAGSTRSDAAGTGPAAWEFPTTLCEILKAYLDEGYPDIAFTATIVGCSVRTLQRRLDKFQLSYTDVVQQARFEAASELLRIPGTKVIEAANAVGFDDPAHFARAFRRQAGISPKQYRGVNPA